MSLKRNLSKGLPLVVLLILVFLAGYGLASFQGKRLQITKELDSFHREILIAFRLLDQYTGQCDVQKHINFSDYIVHANDKYALVLNKANGFPYYLGLSASRDHYNSIYEFNERVSESRAELLKCNNQTSVVETHQIQIILPKYMGKYKQQMTEFAQFGGDNPFQSVEMTHQVLIQEVEAKALAQRIAQTMLTDGFVVAGEVSDFNIDNGTAYIVFGMDEDGWAGVSVAMAEIRPLVELNLLQYPEINKVHFGRKPE
ncbi:hypothetical protein MK852_09690 [Shewanella benthica]|uniref:hypothetical protein n=1 Tax=Shewanella benthica TaxID=43661 RepID=UPI00187AD128|nr:hypothetical protein [Shewanella benthica]MBE7215500.1 hypothetical protein [Shewanella benthica]MCL1062410.1 hypothetical protein [Shewanella benthica]